MTSGFAELDDEALELAALDPDRSADVDDGQPMPGDLSFHAAAGAPQLAGDLVESEQQGAGNGPGRGAGVCSGLHVASKCDLVPRAITAAGGRGGTLPEFGGTQWGDATESEPLRHRGR